MHMLFAEAQTPTAFPTPFGGNFGTPAPTLSPYNTSSSSPFCFYAVSNSVELNAALSQASTDTRDCEVFFTVNASMEYNLTQEYQIMYGSVHLDASIMSISPIIYAAPGNR